MIDASAFIETLNQKPVAVFGLGASGMATLKWLHQNNINTFAWDDKKENRQAAEGQGAKVQNLNSDILKNCSCLVLSPGVPLTHPEPHDVVKAANAAKCEIIGDIEIFHRCASAYQTIGITGTNGKSTTTALLTHTLNACGKTALMGGNIGTPILNLTPQDKNTIIVIEMSSYQIDLCPTFRPDIGILLNITPDHIDRHGTFENYTAIKHRLLEGAKHKIYAEQCDQSILQDHNFPMLPGNHNAQNIIAVLETCTALGLNQDDVIKAIKTFPGLAHRQYLVRTINNVTYINDSKATNAEATSKALSCQDNIYWIVGGQAKAGGLDGLEEFSSRITKAYLIGEAANDFQTWMNDQKIKSTITQTLDNAILQAHNDAQDQGKPACILLSPACASWDQFKSFEHRGDQFIQYVESLPA
ncbi:MAG: Mur ligase family protein [Bdellovibrionales bacterium]